MSTPPRKKRAEAKAAAPAPATPPAGATPGYEEWLRLFWEARKEQLAHRGQPSAGPGPAEQAAWDFATRHGWPWAQPLLEASALERTGQGEPALACLEDVAPAIPGPLRWLHRFLQGAAHHEAKQLDEAIRCYLEVVADPACSSPGNAWNNLGLAYSDLGRHEEAIAAYEKVLATPGYDTPGDTWYNLGLAYRDLGHHEEAVAAYEKALATPGYATPGDAWNNLGLTYRALGRHEEAVAAYEKALATPGYATPGMAWNNLGVAYSALGRHEEAVAAYEKALATPAFDTPGDAWHNLGVAYRALDRPEEAIAAYEKALALLPKDDVALTWNNLGLAYKKAGLPEKAKEAYEKALQAGDKQGNQHARARLALQTLQGGLPVSSLSPDDQALIAPPSGRSQDGEFEGKIIAAIKEAENTQYDKYLDKPASGREACLSILRGWSSAVTLLEGSERRWRGGGYFIKWRGHGIVMDPGFDFLRNFHDAGYHGREISLVIVSHNHPDHNSDLKAIDDLRYETYVRQANKTLPDGTPDPGGQPYLLVWDEDTSQSVKFASEKPRHRLDAIALASGFPQPVNLEEHPSRLPVRIIPFKAKHGDDVRRAMGCIIELLDENHQPALRLGYTADTGYFPELASKFTGCHAVIAHISQPSIEELQDETGLKEVHLGYRGTIKLLKEIKENEEEKKNKAPLALIGEFWAGFTDLRIALTKGLRHHTGLKHILPTGLGLHLTLPGLEVECTECRHPTPHASIRVSPPTDEFGDLAYLCPDCLLDPPI